MDDPLTIGNFIRGKINKPIRCVLEIGEKPSILITNFSALYLLVTNKNVWFCSK